MLGNGHARFGGRLSGKGPATLAPRRSAEPTGTLARGWAYVPEYDSEQDRRAALVDFLNHYNHDRPHAGIGHRSPSSRVPQRNYRLTSPCSRIPTTPPPTSASRAAHPRPRRSGTNLVRHHT
ncbi:integrase core domain-containing protein [Nocardia sp. NPDC004711]